ncbi:MAG: cysteine synthase A [Clostridia bacterium]|nr:cysteine synthase A [Clostridia bacterium]
MKIYNKIEELIGNTPLLKVNNLIKELSLQANLFVKLEMFNPAGSIKDRVAYKIIEDAENNGKIKKGGTIIEATSGNTGIGLASIGISKGYKVIIVMPNSMSVERIKLIKSYGAEVVLTDGKLGMQGAVDKAIEINKNTPNSFIASQFENPSNVQAHYSTTAREIYLDLDKNVDFVVAGIGTGGTISGIGKFLKEQCDNIKIVGVEPYSSPLITKGVSGSHKIQGIGANFIPKIFDKTVVDEVFAVKDKDAIKFSRLLATKEGILAGFSSGANLCVGIELANRKENKGKNIVVILPDTGDRYLSTNLFLD